MIRLRDILLIVILMPLILRAWFWLFEPLVGPGHYEANLEALKGAPNAD